MASGTITQGPSPEARRAAHERELIEYERYIDLQLTKTARQVQGMDIATGLMCWLAGALAYLLVAAAADHWLLSGGLGTWGRWLALLGLVVGSGWFLAIRVLPTLLKRINPVYSAHTIEQGRPQLKNSLVNFLLLRREPRELSEAVRDALQSQAASGLAAAPIEHSIDRSPLVRFALVLLGAVLFSALYIMLSPKDPLRSAARVMFPWAKIDRPTRFTIEDIQAEVVETGRKFTDGPAEVFYGQRIKISAAAANRGRVVAEPIVLRFTTADGSASDQKLTLESRERNADITLPAGTLAAAAGGGLQQSFDYTLTAGDAIAGPFHVKVLAAPSIEIEKLEYDFPAYTKLPKRTVTGRADVNALEGTVVTVRARANQEIAQAWIDLDCDGRRDATMLPKGQEAGGNFKLALKDDRRTPVNAGYLLRFKNTDGFENPQPIRYRIDVTPDLAPEIAWTAPREIDEPRTLPVDEALEVAFNAGDKDFELAGVKLRAEVETENKADRKPWETALLNKPSAEKWTSPPTKFVPAQHGFQAGQTVVLWAEASDNRQPKANVAETPKLKITLLPPRDPAEKRGPNHQPNDGSQQKKSGDAEQPPQDGESQDQADGQKQPQQKGAQEQPADQEQQREGKEGDEGEQQGAPQEKQPGEEKQPGDKEQQAGDGEKKPGQEGEASENEQQGGAGDSSEEGESGEGGQSGAGGKQGNRGAEGDKQGDGQEGGTDSSSGGSRNSQQGNRKEGTGANGEEGEPGQGGQGASGRKKPARRVDPDAQDGEAFERMMEHFDEQQKQSSEKGAGNEKKAGERQAGTEQGAEDSGEESKSPDQAPGEEGSDAEAKEGSGQNAAKSKPEDGGAQSGDPQREQENAEGMEKPKPGDETGKPQAGKEGDQEGEAGAKGAQERAGEDQNRGKESSDAAGEQSKPGDNQPSAENQRSGGAGQGNEKESGGTPEAQGDNKQRDKDGEGQGGRSKEGQEEPQSPSTSNHQSNSKGGQSGSESGGGSKGGGQNAEQEGTGSSGSHTEADDGGGAAQQSGDGETGQRGGDDRESQNATGDKNAQQAPGTGREGEGNRSSNDAGKEGGEKGSQGSGKNSAQPQQKQSDGSDQPPGDGEGTGTPNGSRESGPSRAGNNDPVGGGQGGDESEPPPPKEPQELGGDAANQDYANRATELVLDRLKDQLKKGQPDEALLDKLQWSKEDLERFVKRWEEMKANAKQPGAKGNKAKDELDQALKGLGLRPKGTSTKAGKTRQDKASGIRDSRRSEPPAEYAEQYQQYNVGTSKGK